MAKINFNLPSGSVRRWTPSTVECYRRYCICEGCTIVPYELKGQCSIKSYVLMTYTKFGKPED